VIKSAAPVIVSPFRKNDVWIRCICGSGVVSIATPCTVAVTGVKINEVESNGGTPGDWFELINTATTAADLSGWKMLDNDDTHTPYVFPAGSVIAPGGYLVVEEAQFVFGLGAPDSVRIYDATGAIYDTYSWTAHATTTYGRCPNGTGELTTTTSDRLACRTGAQQRGVAPGGRRVRGCGPRRKEHRARR